MLAALYIQNWPSLLGQKSIQTLLFKYFSKLFGQKSLILFLPQLCLETVSLLSNFVLELCLCVRAAAEAPPSLLFDHNHQKSCDLGHRFRLFGCCVFYGRWSEKIKFWDDVLPYWPAVSATAHTQDIPDGSVSLLNVSSLLFHCPVSLNMAETEHTDIRQKSDVIPAVTKHWTRLSWQFVLGQDLNRQPCGIVHLLCLSRQGCFIKHTVF